MRNPAGGIQTLTDVVVQEWRKLVQEEIETELAIIQRGDAVMSLEDYKRRTGRIWGLNRAVELMRSAASKVEKAS